MCNNNNCGECESGSSCKKKKTKSFCFEDTCVEQTFDLRQIRYKTQCDEFSNLENLNIGIGDNLEYIIEEFGQRLIDYDFLNAPQIPNHPELKTFESIILYLLNKIDNLQQQINNK